MYVSRVATIYLFLFSVSKSSTIRGFPTFIQPIYSQKVRNNKKMNNKLFGIVKILLFSHVLLNSSNQKLFLVITCFIVCCIFQREIVNTDFCEFELLFQELQKLYTVAKQLIFRGFLNILLNCLVTCSYIHPGHMFMPMLCRFLGTAHTTVQRCWHLYVVGGEVHCHKHIGMCADQL